MSIALSLDSDACPDRLTLVLLGRPQGAARALLQWARGRADVDVLSLMDARAAADPVQLAGLPATPPVKSLPTPTAQPARTDTPVWLHLGGQGAMLAGEHDAPRDHRPHTPPAQLPFDVRDPAARLPLPDHSVDGIRLDHLLARVRDAHALLAELHRVARPGARLQIRVAHGQAPGLWDTPGTVRPWFEGSFAFFAQPALAASPHILYTGDWQLQAVHCVHEGVPSQTEPDSRQTPCELLATLVAMHPARPREVALRGPRPTPVHCWGLPDRAASIASPDLVCLTE
jgi:SAM-dependent methyltransferase